MHGNILQQRLSAALDGDPVQVDVAQVAVVKHEKPSPCISTKFSVLLYHKESTPADSSRKGGRKMIALACDHTGVALKAELAKMLDEMGLEWKDFGNYDAANRDDDYPVYGYLAAKAVADGECDRGILICGTGIGIGIAAGKVKGIRVCTCSDVYSAELSKRHNDSNILTMGARVVGTELAKMIARHWLTAAFEGGRHQRRIDMIAAIEEGTFNP
jgi:ribose 5-phosphate isomerase B